MRENKYDGLLNASIVILIVSAILLGITGYNLFFKKTHSAAGNTSAAVTGKPDMRDSLRQLYNQTLRALEDNPQLSVNTATDKNREATLNETGSLRMEIDSLLRQHSSDEDLATARIRIEELQRRIAELEGRYVDAATENKRLQLLINRLVQSDKAFGPGATSAPSATRDPIASPAASSAERSPAATSPVAALHLFAVTENKSTEQETTSSDEAEKIVGSFMVQSSAARAGGELVVVVLQPDGKVIKNSVWESGTFDTREGKKVYSRKLYFEPAADEKQLNFSLTPERFFRGDYTLQVWYNGNLVGKMVKTLS